ncbi:asparagine synthase C-terminal domain-containing protein [Dyella sp. A6]|uniref:asparagine synthase C-terminal domain-containing protein n=1 Tax=Dyella aluminiiresistens TaxID=3069105 RepID=UPI002E7951FB|nr:asparagine synthase C-terminal domain-containing protein [Dyella sp. A6]
MLNALTVVLAEGDPVGLHRANDSMQRQGFVAAGRRQWNRGELRTWSQPGQERVEHFETTTSEGFACCAGPVWYRGSFGNDALRLILRDLDATGRIDEPEMRGNFALFVQTPVHCLLLNDVLGLVRLYVSPDRLFYSTSWLATCAYAGQVRLDETAAAEYVLLGASHSERTVAQGISTLRIAHAFDLASGHEQARLSVGGWRAGSDAPTFDAAIERLSEHLRIVFAEVATAFPGRIRAALSGGFDSRLILAGLLAAGHRPELFVYGDAGADDIRIASIVAEQAGIDLDVIDKSALNRPAARPGLQQLVESALFFDGLPNDGIDDPGADRQTRLQQTAGGYVALNGGGGEIFRNFFHLPDRRRYPLDVVRTFYRGFDTGVFRRPGGLASYEDHLVSSMEDALGIVNKAGRTALRREQVELLYPLFRCHHWMSVNNSVGIRHGCYVTPLVDLDMVRLAASLPLDWKNAGRLEARLIRELDAGVAGQPSSYGFRFSDGPDRRARLAEWATCMRPVVARPFINAARRRLQKLGAARELIGYYRTLLPGEWQLDPVLDLERLPDNTAFARALAVEVVWRELLA